MALKINNSPASIYARDGIKDATSSLADVSKKFATGQKLAKPSENLFASLEAAMGSSTMVYTKSALANLTRLRSILATRTGSLETMREGAQELSNISLQAAGALPEDVRTANIDVFAQVMERVANIAETADYGGIKLLNGTFGSAGDFEASNPEVFSPSVNIKAGYATGNGRLIVGSSKSSVDIQIDDAGTDGDTIAIGSTTFTFKEGAANEEANEIQIGTSKAETTRNIMNALAKSKSDDVKKFDFAMDLSLADPIIKATTLFSTDSAIPGATDGGVTVTGGTTSLANPLNAASVVSFGGYTSGEVVGQLGSISIESITQANTGAAFISNYSEAATGQTVGNGGDLNTGGVIDVTDTITKFNFTIGSEDYIGYHFSNRTGGGYTATAGVTDTIFAIKASDDGGDLTGKVFRMKVTEHASMDMFEITNANAFVSNWNNDSESFSFDQTRYMTTNPTVKEVLVGGESIGTLSGMTAQFKGTSFEGLKVSDFEIDSGKMALKMKDAENNIKSFKFTMPANQIIKAGSNITLTSSESDDTVTLTLGGSKDLILNTSEKRDEAAKQIKRALGSSDASTFIVGTDVSQTLSLRLTDMSWAVLTSGKDLSIETQTAAQDATKILSDIVRSLNSEIGLTAAYDKAVDSLFQQMEVSQQNLSAAVESLTAIDIAETREQLDKALQTMSAAMAAIMADNRARKTLERLFDI